MDEKNKDGQEMGSGEVGTLGSPTENMRPLANASLALALQQTF